MEAFDDAAIAPMMGCTDSGQYYREASCARVLHRVRIPLLLVSAANDPIAPAALMPRFSAAELEASGSFKLSQGARELATIRELAFREPEVRADVVRSAAADLAAGALVVDSNTLAEAMLGSLF